MTTILTAFANGKPIGQCDQRCYDAKGGTCRCICNGRNHGIGEDLAWLNTRSQLYPIHTDLRDRVDEDTEIKLLLP